MFYAVTLRFETQKFRVVEGRGIINLNKCIKLAVQRSEICNGKVLVQSKHTTASIVCQEDELGFLQDMRKMLDRLVPRRPDYNHDNFSKRNPSVEPGERKNSKSHLESLLVGRLSVELGVKDFKVDLGNWPSVLFIDFDLPSKKTREIEISVMGE